MGKIEGIKFKLGVSMKDIVDLMDDSSSCDIEITECIFAPCEETNESK
jgi:hypothetical protein